VISTLSVVSSQDATVDITGNSLHIIEGSRVLDHQENLSLGSFISSRVDGLQGVSSVVTVSAANQPYVFAAGTLDALVSNPNAVGKIAMFLRVPKPEAPSESFLKFVGVKTADDDVPQRPHTIKLSPDERFLYVIGETTLSIFSVVPGATPTDAPDLRVVAQSIDNAAVQTLPRTNGKFLSLRFDSPSDFAFSPDGTQVLVTDAGSEDGIVVFRAKHFGRAHHIGNTEAPKGKQFW
jgi:DNA-binding beta-propeller fold protein YncE